MRGSRWPIWAAVIASIYKRDRSHCRYCGCRVIPTQVMRLVSEVFPDDFPYHPNWKGGQTHPAITSRSATLDHIAPWTLGGTNDPENLVCARWICNRIKGDLTLEQMGWELKPIATDTSWDGLSSYYKALWEIAGSPTTGEHPFWIRLFGQGRGRMYLSRPLQTLGVMTVAVALAGCGGSSSNSTTALTAVTPPPTVAGVVRCLRQGGASLVPASNRNEAAATGPDGGIIVVDLFDDPAEGKKAAEELAIERAAAGASKRQISTADGGKVVVTLSNHPSPSDEALAEKCSTGG